MNHGYELLNAGARKSETFGIPHVIERHNLRVGQIVKLLFSFPDGPVERMWVEITSVSNGSCCGKLSSHPLHRDIFQAGDTIDFKAEHVASIWVDA